MQNKPNKMSGGRPTDYTKELVEEICDKIATGSMGLKKLCKENTHWPSHETIYQWLRKHESFADLYTKAKKDQVRALVEDILDISDDSSRDTTYKENGEEALDREWVARARLRVDTRKWIAAKLVPRMYGDNMLARELADEIEEFKRLLEGKARRDDADGEKMDSKNAHEKGRTS
jgi:hypothetical protein